MLHVDTPTDDDLRRMAAFGGTATVSVYLPTTPVTVDADGDRIAFVNLAREALEAVVAGDPPRGVAEAMALHLDDLADDDDFWAHQARGLAVFAAESGVVTFRLAEPAGPVAYAGLRARLAPLVAAATTPRAFLVLDLSADGARLLECPGDGTGAEVEVAGMPTSASDHAGKASINDRSHSGRLVGDEGRNVHLRSYVRAVDAALRPLLHGQAEPLVLVATEPLASMFRSVSTYAHLSAEGISTSADQLDDDAVARLATPVADRAASEAIAGLVALLDERQNAGRAALDPSTVARAAVQGAVDTLLIDTSVSLPGSVGDDGSLLQNGDAGGVGEDLVRLVLATGGTVRHVPATELPDETPTAAILRWAAS
jgi:hypothetical protein